MSNEESKRILNSFIKKGHYESFSEFLEAITVSLENLEYYEYMACKIETKIINKIKEYEKERDKYNDFYFTQGIIRALKDLLKE